MYTNVYYIYKIFQKLRKNKIRHCLFYIGEKDGNRYEENLLKYLKLDKNNNKLFEIEKEPNYDDIIINDKIPKKYKWFKYNKK